VPIYHLDIEIEYDFELIGLSSHEKDYRLAWSLNRQMGWSLKRTNDIELARPEGFLTCACFEYTTLHEKTKFTLLDNKSDAGLLMAELPQFDFLLKIENLQQPLSDDFYRQLKKTPLLIASFLLATEKLKNKHYLLTTPKPLVEKKIFRTHEKD
jgi:hypothetical protein